MKFHRWSVRLSLCGLLALATLLGVGCSGAYKPPDTSPPSARATPMPSCTDATVAYYYRYKDATPDQSDIAFIEVVPPGPRCVAISSKAAPVFPDSAISAYVASGAMNIDVPTPTVEIKDKADVAVYYKAATTTALLDRTPVAVENLAGVSRMIKTASVVKTGSTSCGGSCRSYPCNGYSCCQPPPC